MPAFLFAYSLAGLTVCLFNDPSSLLGSGTIDERLPMLLELVAVPGLAAWLTAAVLHRRRRRKIFTPGSRNRWVGGAARGLVAGVLSMVILNGLVVLGDRYFSDPVLVAAAAILGTGIVVKLSPRVRPGQCLSCDYDIRASLHTGRCPECGSILRAWTA